ncbi:hypothetical protein C8J56DRAFT_883249 [Mycena floridula]|nr:hypothetical protein C8J56DRAFT_883249 [Mycena floridula]
MPTGSGGRLLSFLMVHCSEVSPTAHKRAEYPGSTMTVRGRNINTNKTRKLNIKRNLNPCSFPFSKIWMKLGGERTILLVRVQSKGVRTRTEPNPDTLTLPYHRPSSLACPVPNTNPFTDHDLVLLSSCNQQLLYYHRAFKDINYARRIKLLRDLSNSAKDPSGHRQANERFHGHLLPKSLGFSFMPTESFPYSHGKHLIIEYKKIRS